MNGCYVFLSGFGLFYIHKTLAPPWADARVTHLSMNALDSGTNLEVHKIAAGRIYHVIGWILVILQL